MSVKVVLYCGGRGPHPQGLRASLNKDSDNLCNREGSQPNTELEAYDV
jgi:hypothetical protein